MLKTLVNKNGGFLDDILIVQPIMQINKSGNYC